MKIAIISARFNEEITKQLHEDAKETLLQEGIPKDCIIEQWVPGAFELPYMSQHIAETRDVDVIIAIGAVIKGETAHFEFIAKGATDGIMRVSLDCKVPIIFGVLTTYTKEQAQERAGPHRLGREWALGAIEMAKHPLLPAR